MIEQRLLDVVVAIVAGLAVQVAPAAWHYAQQQFRRQVHRLRHSVSTGLQKGKSDGYRRGNRATKREDVSPRLKETPTNARKGIRGSSCNRNVEKVRSSHRDPRRPNSL
jgi:hypothetical protein